MKGLYENFAVDSVSNHGLRNLRIRNLYSDDFSGDVIIS